jgi:hypothetical protein
MIILDFYDDYDSDVDKLVSCILSNGCITEDSFEGHYTSSSPKKDYRTKEDRDLIRRANVERSKIFQEIIDKQLKKRIQKYQEQKRDLEYERVLEAYLKERSRMMQEKAIESCVKTQNKLNQNRDVEKKLNAIRKIQEEEPKPIPKTKAPKRVKRVRPPEPVTVVKAPKKQRANQMLPNYSLDQLKKMKISDLSSEDLVQLRSYFSRR